MLKGLIRALGAVLIAIALYSVLGFLILPGIGLRIINQQLANYATVPAKLDRLEFNPFSLELTLWGLRVGEPGKEQVGFERLYTNLQADSLWTKALHLAAVELDKPKTELLFNKDGTLNLTQLFKLPASEPTPADPESKPFPLRIDNIKLAGGYLHFTDMRPSEPIEFLYDSMDLELKNLSTLPDDNADMTLVAAGPAGGRIDWTGTLSLVPITSTGKLKVTDGKMKVWWPYVRDALPLALEDGVLNFSTDYTLNLSKETEMVLSNATASIAPLKINAPDGRPLVRLERLEVSDTSVDLAKQEVVVGKINSQNLETWAAREKDGQLDWQKLFASQPEKAPAKTAEVIMAMVQDIRVILIKLADRTHNMRTLGSLRPDKRRRIARETLEIYSPLAHRLGIHHIKTELEELGFEALYPNRYRVIKKVVKAARGNRKEMIQKILSEIEGRLQEAGIPCRVSGREKHLYSIYCKMVLKEQRFHSIMDIYAFRVIVNDSDTCYRVLGQMHSLYKPRPGRVKDYIAIPKANGYQSLHTSMIGPHGVPVEVQIRTEDMDQMAEMGVAAHWAYKEHGETSTTAQIRAQRWMQSLLELQQSAGSSFEFIESVKSDLFPDEIYVFTPEGRIVELPAGATPVDFAYAVHTDIGHACVGARVDRQPYPLSQPLTSGQTVEIITAPGARPNAAWLNFVVSSKARAKIRQLLKNLKRDDSVSLGRRLLNHALGGSRKLNEIPQENIQRELDRMKLATLDDLLAEIGLGNAMSVVVAKNLQHGDASIPPATQSHGHLPIKGADGVLITFAKCCRPIPGDPIIAHVSPGKGLVIHHESCRNIRGYQKEPEKFMAVEWDKETAQEFITEIKVEMFNHQGALANLTAAINTTTSNIQSLNTEEKDGRVYSAFIRLTARDRVHLANIMRKIRVMPDVIKVTRNRN